MRIPDARRATQHTMTDAEHGGPVHKVETPRAAGRVGLWGPFRGDRSGGTPLRNERSLSGSAFVAGQNVVYHATSVADVRDVAV
jgi:hypothetical protein